VLARETLTAEASTSRARRRDAGESEAGWVEVATSTMLPRDREG
jgi:hypothetical protein